MAKEQKIVRQADLGDGQMMFRVKEEHSTINDNIIPAPDDLQRLADIDPNFPAFFMELARNEQQQRREAIKASVEAVSTNDKRNYRLRLFGLCLAFLCVVLFLGLCGYALYLDKPWIASFIGLFSLATIVSVFVTGKSHTNKD